MQFNLKKNHICFENTQRRSPTIHPGLLLSSQEVIVDVVDDEGEIAEETLTPAHCSLS